MKKRSASDLAKLEGQKLPKMLRDITWADCIGGDQQYGDDAKENNWRKSKKRDYSTGEWLPGFRMWTSVSSEHREHVSLSLTILMDENEIIEAIEVEANAVYCLGGGRPSAIEPLAAEKKQIAAMFRDCFSGT